MGATLGSLGLPRNAPIRLKAAEELVADDESVLAINLQTFLTNNL